MVETEMKDFKLHTQCVVVVFCSCLFFFATKGVPDPCPSCLHSISDWGLSKPCLLFLEWVAMLSFPLVQGIYHTYRYMSI